MTGRSVFEVKGWDLAGRIATLEVKGRKVSTPALMPVINPNSLRVKNAVTPLELFEEFSFEMIITNSYIILQKEDLREEAASRGLHEMLDFPGMIMTDSGTFQSYVYGSEIEVDPNEIVDFQNRIDSDIGTILDRFTVPNADRSTAEADLNTTLNRAAASMEVRREMELAVPVQGGLHPDLRERSGRSVRNLGVAYAPIGGVVPLMESYRYGDLVDVIAASKRGLGPSIPVHLFGAGHPMIMPIAVALGCDMFDSASYAKFASADRYMTMDRTRHLDDMDSLPCSCPVCCRREARDIRDVPVEERIGLLMRHNLWVLRSAMNEIREAISEGTLWELVERSASFNPSLHTAVRRLSKYRDQLEENAPRSTRRFMCSSDLSLCRPEFDRYWNMLKERYHPPDSHGVLVLDDWSRMYSHRENTRLEEAAGFGIWSVIRTPLGPAPFDIIDRYPISQSVFPDPDSLEKGLEEEMEERMKWIPKVCGERFLDITDDMRAENGGPPIDLDLLKLVNLTRMQFGIFEGKGADAILFGYESVADLKERIRLKRSRRTGKIRNVYLEEGGESIHVLSLRAEDGLFTLKLGGARFLHSGSGGIWNRVVVDVETGEFNAMGRNVFCKFVLNADPSVRPGDEVIVEDENGTLLAVGKSNMSGNAMMEFRAGVAVKVREGIRSEGGR